MSRIEANPKSEFHYSLTNSQRQLATHWHDGQGSHLYSACSTGKVQTSWFDRKDEIWNLEVLERHLGELNHELMDVIDSPNATTEEVCTAIDWVRKNTTLIAKWEAKVDELLGYDDEDDDEPRHLTLIQF